MTSHKDEAVSPVVGVMLMLVVVIIIAAVVSAFAGGMAGEQQKTPQAAVTATLLIDSIDDTDTSNYIPDYPAGFKAMNGILFEHNGGDSFTLDEISVVLQQGDSKYTLTNSETIDRSASIALPAEIPTYLNKTGSDGTRIKSGDRFILYADNCKITSIGSAITWKPSGASKDFTIYQDDKIQYKIIDRGSSRMITSGEFIYV